MKVWVRDDVERMINENEALHVKLDKLNERRRSRYLDFYFNEFLRCMPLQKMKNLCAL